MMNAEAWCNYVTNVIAIHLKCFSVFLQVYNVFRNCMRIRCCLFRCLLFILHQPSYKEIKENITKLPEKLLVNERHLILSNKARKQLMCVKMVDIPSKIMDEMVVASNSPSKS